MSFFMCCIMIILAHISSLPVLNSSTIQKNDEIVNDHKLDRKVLPKSYSLIMILDQDWYTTDAFRGEVQIEVEIVKEINRNIRLHSKDLRITVIQVDGNDASFEPDDLYETITITAAEDLSPGAHSVKITFDGRLSLTDMHGFYKSSYEDDQGNTHYLAATQFEATHARRAFPCFDEPEFKAIFELLLMYPDESGVYNALANQDIQSSSIQDGTAMISFYPTPQISTYLIAFVVSKFNCDSGVSLNGGIPYEVCSRPEAKATREFAVDIGPHLMRVLEKFTGTKYGESGIRKMTQIAIPDFSAGAMENWGLVTYRETGLLWDEDESSSNYKQRLASVISHEFAHMWFGNSVTMKWWDDIFLNEGFARYFQYFGTNEVFSCWKLDKQFIIEQVHTALLADSKMSSKELSSKVDTPTEISAKFGTISYNKGASIFRMVINFVGETQFKEGIQNYLKEFESKNADNNDLWTHLHNAIPVGTLPSGTTLNTVMENWTKKPGYPVVNVALNGNTVKISQKRFLINGEDIENTKWYVPVTFTIASSQDKFQSRTTSQKWMLPDEVESDLTEISSDKSEWIILNNQQVGYYRVKYDDNLLDRIYRGLFEEDFDNIDVISRTQITDDAFNFARIGEIRYSILFRLVSFLKRDAEYYPWYAAFQGFSYILSKLESENLKTAMKNHILNEMEGLLRSVPIDIEHDDDQIYTLKREMAHKWACKLGSESCIASTKNIFAAYRNTTDSVKPSKNLRHVVYCTALQNSDEIEEDWAFLWDKYIQTKLSTEQVTILNVLGCTTNMVVLNRYLEYIIDNKVRIQDNKLIFSSIYNNNLWGVSIALDFYALNYQKIYEYYGIKYANSLLETLAEQISSRKDIEKLSNLLNIQDIEESTKATIEAAITTASQNMDVVENLETELNEYFFRKNGSSGLIQQGNLFSVFIISITMILSILENYY